MRVAASGTDCPAKAGAWNLASESLFDIYDKLTGTGKTDDIDQNTRDVCGWVKRRMGLVSITAHSDRCPMHTICSWIDSECVPIPASPLSVVQISDAVVSATD